MERIGRKDKFKCTKGEVVTFRFTNEPPDGVVTLHYAIRNQKKPYPQVKDNEFKITVNETVFMNIYVAFDPMQKKALTKINLTTEDNTRGFETTIRWSESPPIQGYTFVID